MKLLIILAIGFSLTSCSESGNANRSYVISKSQVEPVEIPSEE